MTTQAPEAPETPVEEIVDLSDLDLLDDETEHALCVYCYPPRQWIGKVVITVCGVEALLIKHFGPRCQRCTELMAAPCPKCGRR